MTSHRRDVGRPSSSGSRSLSALALAGGIYAFLHFSDRGRSLVKNMQHDMKVIKERDPAATSNIEILTCYPGLHAIWFHRASRALWERDIPLAPRLISQTGRLLTGIEIHPGATLGDGLFIDHGSGVVIGETAEIGENVTIYQGVTLGGTGKETGKRHPTVGDNVVIGAGSHLLGSIKVGDNVKVGAGSVVVHDVPSDSTVVGNPGRPVIMGGAKVAIPDIDYFHLPDPVAEAMKCLVRRVVGLENELEEIRASDRRAAASSGQSESSEEAPVSDDACDPARVDGLPEI